MQQFLPIMVVEKETLSMPPQGGQPVKDFVMFHDGTWLYGKYMGALLVAIAQDDNNKILLIAFAIVKSELAEAWLFFLQNLKRHVT